MVKLKLNGEFSKTKSIFQRWKKQDFYKDLESYGEKGVEALRNATPVDTGLTSNSWSYNIEIHDGKARITWTNSNETHYGYSIALLIQYGHATRNGTFIEGIDFINPAIQPVFEDLADKIWMEVIKG